MRRLIDSTPGATVVASSPGYLRAEYRSPILRFVDDLELRIDADRRSIQVRSASRVGSWDFGVNRRRVETLRQRLDRTQR